MANLFLYAEMAKILLRVAYPYFTWNSCQWSVCIFYACRFTYRVERSVATHANKWNVEKQRKPKKVKLFQKWSIDMPMQLQVLSMHALTSLLYMLQRMSENMFSCNKTPKTQRIEFYPYKNNQWLFSCQRQEWYVWASENIAYLLSPFVKKFCWCKVYNSLSNTTNVKHSND